MKNTAIKFTVIILTIVLINAAGLAKTFAASSSSIIGLANSSRAQVGLGALTLNSQLASAALAKAQDMFANDYFAHTSPDGKTPWDFIKGGGYSYEFAGENLAIGYTDNQELHDAWMNSPSHRANIMNPNFNEIGVAVLEGEYQGSDTTIVVQMFGAKPNEEPQVASASDETIPQSESTQPQTDQPADQPTETNKAKEFNILKDKTGFEPTEIFVGDKAEFTVVLTGKISRVEIKVGDKVIVLTDALTSEAEATEKVYQTKETFSAVGEFPVTLTITDESGNTETADLGKLKVSQKIIQNPAATNNFTSGFTKTLENNIVLVSSLVALATLAFAVTLYIRYHRTGKLI